jgi:heptosyltransferase-1
MHILIVKMSSLGDILQAFPVLSYIQQNYPNASVDWVVEEPFKELVQAHPFIREVFCVDTKKWRKQVFCKESWKEFLAFRRKIRQKKYNFVFDLQGNIKSGLMTACAKSYLKIGFGSKTVAEIPNVLFTKQRWNPPPHQNIREDYLYLLKSTFSFPSDIPQKAFQLLLTQNEKSTFEAILRSIDHVSEVKIMICPGAHWINKQLSIETWRIFLKCILENLSAQLLFIWGTVAEKTFAQEITKFLPPQKCLLVDKVSLPILQNLMIEMDQVIAMDSLALHLVGTTDTPSYSVFGSSAAHKYRPLGSQHSSFQGECPYQEQFSKRCQFLRSCKTGACVKEIDGKKLFAHFMNNIKFSKKVKDAYRLENST